MNCAPHTVYFCSSQFTSHSRHLAVLTDLYSSDLAGHNSAGPADMAGYNFALAGPAVGKAVPGNPEQDIPVLADSP